MQVISLTHFWSALQSLSCSGVGLEIFFFEVDSFVVSETHSWPETQSFFSKLIIGIVDFGVFDFSVVVDLIIAGLSVIVDVNGLPIGLKIIFVSISVLSHRTGSRQTAKRRRRRNILILCSAL